MSVRTRVIGALGTLIVYYALLPSSASAAPLLLNGGFENGLTSWLTTTQPGSEGAFLLQTGNTSPLSGMVVQLPPGGTFAAMSDQLGPGSHVLYQDFVVPNGVTAATLSFDLLINNLADNFYVPSPPTLDFSTPALNQQARVDLLLASSDPFSVAAADVLQNLYQTDPGDPLITPYFATASDLSALLAAHAGQTLRLRFAQVDNLLNFNLGVDNVNLEAQLAEVPVPEPGSLILFGTALTLAASRRARASSGQQSMQSRPHGSR